MPTDKDFKRLVRARMAKTGEAYTTARAHLRPDDPDGDPGRPRGRHPDTAALTRLLAALGVTDPSSGRPLTEAMALGVAGGIGFAYFVFEYEELTTLYLGGRLNAFVQKQDATEAALARLGVPAQIRRTSGPATTPSSWRRRPAPSAGPGWPGWPATTASWPPPGPPWPRRPWPTCPTAPPTITPWTPPPSRPCWPTCTATALQKELR
jgi:hypothetical protein